MIAGTFGFGEDRVALIRRVISGKHVAIAVVAFLLGGTTTVIAAPDLPVIQLVRLVDRSNGTQMAAVGADGSLAVRITGNPKIEPVNLGAAQYCTDPGLLACFATLGIEGTPFVVPAGKRLVIETVSAEIDLPLGEEIVVVNFMPASYGPGIVHLIPQYTSRGTWIAMSPVRAYVEAGHTVRMTAYKAAASAGEWFADFRAIGYLVELP
jgi:hypothetical protein